MDSWEKERIEINKQSQIETQKANNEILKCRNFYLMKRKLFILR